MLNNNLLLAVLLGTLIYFMFVRYQSAEGYRDISPSGSPTGRTIRRKRHVLFDPTNRLERIQYRPPDYDTERNNCVHINCPPVFESDVICWKCKSVNPPMRENLKDDPDINFFSSYTSTYE